MICQACDKELPEDQFPYRTDTKKRRPYCGECARDAQRSRYIHHRKSQPFKHKAARIKSRASSLGVPCDLDQEYLEGIWTGICPVYGFPINISGGRGVFDTAELDRFNPELGYIKGNVRFLSRKANSHKNNMTLEEVKQLLVWMEKEHARKSD